MTAMICIFGTGTSAQVANNDVQAAAVYVITFVCKPVVLERFIKIEKKGQLAYADALSKETGACTRLPSSFARIDAGYALPLIQKTKSMDSTYTEGVLIRIFRQFKIESGELT